MTTDDKVTVTNNKVTLRFPPAIMQRLNENVSKGLYMSVSDEIRHAVFLMFLNEDRRAADVDSDASKAMVSVFDSS